MAIKGQDTVTVIDYTDVSNFKTWYKAVLRTSAAPTVAAGATEAQMRTNGWDTTEPGVDTTKKLYKVDQCIFGDGTYVWGDVSLSSSYEAAIQAYNKATAAESTANTTAEYFWFDTVGSGAYVTQIPRDQFESNPSGGNTLITSSGMAIRDGSTNLASFGATEAIVGKNTEKNIRIHQTDGLGFYKGDVKQASLTFSDAGAMAWTEKKATLQADSTLAKASIETGVSTAYQTSNVTLESQWDNGDDSIYGLQKMTANLTKTYFELEYKQTSNGVTTGTDIITAYSDGDVTLGGDLRVPYGNITTNGNIVAQGDLTIKGHDSPIGDLVAGTETTKSNSATATWVEGSSVALSNGIWVITAHVNFAQNTTGRRAIAIYSGTAQMTPSLINQSPTSGAITHMVTTYILSTSGSTVSIRHYQTSGGQLSATSIIRAVRIR